jgi:hypothetical protein
MGIGSVAVSEATGKSVTDHTISAVNNKDCRVVRALKSEQVCHPTELILNKVVSTGVTPSSIQEIEARYR